ncbi:hypothetical protein A3G54_00360 [Candidatus Giovannonibacteria bacterium RIFCSPLOWO2_12_FULL_44_15]|uniref:Glutamate/phenylalanine/leucine/valine/L-tryptophan dehydrogenase C-terminal domain-containing protein n=1 Tax=Candidatus Giovannonibacteria bacterium RIFCSPLOWO2_12_FULL_44_15 TaxID=1798364 RepID=A0A1F5XZR1_9BACT|nr:MAG: hypothetical protein A3G54_00360 [Candidatus Giovannonibacteria bacterium RIFCSPLOWO2_12_FULL_44_15]
MHLARILHENNFKVIAVSDSKGELYDSLGLNIPKLLDKNSWYDRNISNEDMLGVEADIFVPAAIEGSINKENARNVKAKIILEMANGGIAKDTYEILDKSGVMVIPDILANGGGVAGSYVEWISNKENKNYGEEKEFKMIEDFMAIASKKVWMRKEKMNTDLRTAAYIFSLERLEKEIKSKILNK